MKQSRREFLRWSALLGVSTTLAACAQPTPTPGAEPEPTKAAEAPTAAPAPKENVKVTVWFADRRTINDMTEKEAKPEFEEAYPHLQLEVVFVPEAEIPAKIATAFAAAQAPDITALDESQLAGFLAQGFVNSIPDGVIDVPGEMGPRIAEVYKLDAKYWALPNGNMPQILFCNVDLLQKLGYSVEDIPSTRDEFIAWAKELTVWEGDEIKQWGYTWVGAPWAWLDYGYQTHTFVFKNAKESNFDDPVFADAWRYWLELMDVQKLDFRTAPLGGPHERVAQGMAVTGVQSGFGCGWFLDSYPDVNWATLPQPTVSGKGPYAQANDDLGFCNTTQRKDAEEVEASWTLWRYLVGPDYQRRYCPLRGVHPSLLELQKEEQFSESNPRWRGSAITAKPGNYLTDGVWTAEVSTLIWQDAVERVQNKGEPIEDVLADHKAKIDKILGGVELPLLLGRDGWQAQWEQS